MKQKHAYSSKRPETEMCFLFLSLTQESHLWVSASQLCHFPNLLTYTTYYYEDMFLNYFEYVKIKYFYWQRLFFSPVSQLKFSFKQFIFMKCWCGNTFSFMKCTSFADKFSAGHFFFFLKITRSAFYFPPKRKVSIFHFKFDWLWKKTF